MDRVEINRKLKELFGKYKYVLLILAVGILLMSLPEKEQQAPSNENPVTASAPATKTEELEEILGQISGVGKVRVMLTEAEGAQTVYQTDEDRSVTQDSENLRLQTVIVSGSDRQEHGLVRSITPPVYLGAIIVCQGGDSPTVKLSIVEAVSNVTGISSDRITVLKMK